MLMRRFAESSSVRSNHCVAAAKAVKLTGAKNDLLERIAADETFGLSEEELHAVIDPTKFTGMAVQQTETFLREQVQPVLDENRALLGTEATVTV